MLDPLELLEALQPKKKDEPAQVTPEAEESEETSAEASPEATPE